MLEGHSIFNSYFETSEILEDFVAAADALQAFAVLDTAAVVFQSPRVRFTAADLEKRLTLGDDDLESILDYLVELGVLRVEQENVEDPIYSLSTDDPLFDFYGRVVTVAFKCRLPQKHLDVALFPQAPELHRYISTQRRIGFPAPFVQAETKSPIIENQIFFESFLAEQYAGNPKYIYEYLLEQQADLKFVWAYEKEPTNIPGNPTIVRRATKEYYEQLAKSKYLVNSTVFPLWGKRDGAVFLQTWHGTPYKRLHWDVTNRPLRSRSTPPFYAKSKSWDALLAANHFSAQHFRTAFRFDGEILPYGYPANDLFYDQQRCKKLAASVRSRLQIPEDARVLLYAPTWRDGAHVGNWKFNFSMSFSPEDLLKNLDNNTVLLLRMHYMSLVPDFGKLSGRILNVSSYDDVHELMAASDVLITDYSSIMFDWACSNKPVILYTPDYDDYVGNLRGSYFDLKEVSPWAICANKTELLSELQTPTAPNARKLACFTETFCSLHDGRSAERVTQWLLSR